MAKERLCSWYMESDRIKTRSRPNLQSGTELWRKHDFLQPQLEKFTIIWNWYLTGVSMAVAGSISSRMIWTGEKKSDWERDIVEKLCYKT